MVARGISYSILCTTPFWSRGLAGLGDRLVVVDCLPSSNSALCHACQSITVICWQRYVCQEYFRCGPCNAVARQDTDTVCVLTPSGGSNDGDPLENLPEWFAWVVSLT